MSNKAQNKPSKKERLSLMTVKTLLAILLFTGMAVIIIGGGYIIVKYTLISPDKTDLPIINPIVEAQCEVNSDCYLVYVSDKDYVCQPCDRSSEKYQCLTVGEMKKLKNKGNKIDESVLCSSCSSEFDKYTCKCANGKCEKVKIEEVEDVVITIDKMEYEIGEEVEITITNNQNEPIYISPYNFSSLLNYSISKFENDSWKLTSQDRVLRSSCYNNTLMRISIIPPAYISEFKSPQVDKWEQTECFFKEQMCGDELYSAVVKEQVETGKYKIRFCYWNEEDVDLVVDYIAQDDKKKCIESEFTIKEKSVLDSRCSEKVKGIGICDRYNKGYAYEFDSEIGKCVEEDRVTGCSFEIPFRTLKECQKVCEKRECAEKGEFINYPQGTNENLQDVCCERLKGLLGYRMENGKCEILLGGPFLTCMPCGNGICETMDNFNENECNCPEDCEN